MLDTEALKDTSSQIEGAVGAQLIPSRLLTAAQVPLLVTGREPVRAVSKEPRLTSLFFRGRHLAINNKGDVAFHQHPAKDVVPTTVTALEPIRPPNGPGGGGWLGTPSSLWFPPKASQKNVTLNPLGAEAKILAVSLKHWKRRRGVSGGIPPLLLRCTAATIHHCPPAPCVTFRLVVVPLRGPGQSPVLPFACCVGSLLSVGRCGRCSCWCRFRVRGAQ